jgi:hypothetical protein
VEASATLDRFALGANLDSASLAFDAGRAGNVQLLVHYRGLGGSVPVSLDWALPLDALSSLRFRLGSAVPSLPEDDLFFPTATEFAGDRPGAFALVALDVEW